MNYKGFITILLILTIISTLCICIIKPKMHKSVLVYNSDFKIIPQNDVEVEVQNIPTVEQNQSTSPQVVKVIHFEDSDDVYTNSQTVPAQVVEQVKMPQTQVTYTTQTTRPQTNVFTTQQVKQPTFQNITTTSQKVVQTPVSTTQTKVNSQSKVNTPQIDLQKILENNKKYQTQHTSQPVKEVVSTPAPVQTKVVSAPVGIKTPTKTSTNTSTTSTKSPEPVKILTPQEEEIAWQVWRSNLQNRIMRDAKLPNVPQGTIFKFSFDVDKYGKISNVHTYCTTNTQYTPYAIQYIAPVIKAYQGRSILDFPKGSQRVTTSFVGSFKVSNSSKYSSASDYRDTERVSK